MEMKGENIVNLSHTNLSKPEACGRLAGGKAEGRHPRSASHFLTALKGRWNGLIAFLAPLQGAEIFLVPFRGYHPLKRVQPPANILQPCGLPQMALARI